MDNNKKRQFKALLVKEFVDGFKVIGGVLLFFAALGALVWLPIWVAEIFGPGWGFGVLGGYLLVMLGSYAVSGALKKAGMRLKDLFR